MDLSTHKEQQTLNKKLNVGFSRTSFKLTGTLESPVRLTLRHEDSFMPSSVFPPQPVFNGFKVIGRWAD